MTFERILVTGGCGFIGRQFVQRLLDARADVRVTNLDALVRSSDTTGLADLLGTGRYTFVRADVRDEAVVGPLVAEADAVVHLAAESHVDRSIEDAAPFVSTNVTGTHVLLEAARRAGDARGRPIRFVYCSTDEVYGSLELDEARRFREDDPMRPNNPYAATKAAGDLLARSYHATHGLDLVVTRCCNAMGPGQYPDKLVPLFVSKLSRDEPVPLYGDGLHVREWIAVEDAADAIRFVLERGVSGEAYNIGSGMEVSNLGLARALLRILDKPESLIGFVADRAGHDRRYAIDGGKLGALGYAAHDRSWREVLERTVRASLG